MIKIFGQLLDGLLDGIFPPRCPGCGCSVHKNGQWCRACLDSIGQPHRIALTAEQCNMLSSCVALCRYRHGVRRLLQQVKYNSSRRGIVALRCLAGLRLDGAVGQQLVAADTATVIVPVPLHQQRRSKRGFNQTNEIFQQWAANHNISWQELLVRNRDTRPQYSLNRQERRLNVKNAFQFSGRNLNKQPVILVDDIFTTGATMLACAKVLKQHGAGKITGLVLASDAE